MSRGPSGPLVSGSSRATGSPRARPDRQDRFPFFVGCGRSGTTLLRAIMNAHPRLAVPYESHWAVALARVRHRYERSGSFDVDAFLADLLPDERYRRWGIPDAEVRASFTGDPVRTYPDAVRRVYALYAATQGKERYANKTGNYVTRMREIVALFPEAVFVHLVRDGRDVALSRLAVAWGDTRFDEAVLSWRQQVDAGRRAARALGLGPQRYLEVRYEHLVTDPAGVARTVCAFLDLEFVPEMLDTTTQAERIISEVLDPAEHQNLRLPPTPGLRDWRAEMTPAQVELFEALAGRTLADFGYPPGPRRPGAAVRLRAAALRFRRGVLQSYGRLKSRAWWWLHPDGQPPPPLPSSAPGGSS